MFIFVRLFHNSAVATPVINERDIQVTSVYIVLNKANLRDLIAATGLIMLLKLDSNVNFQHVLPWNLMDDLEKTIEQLIYTTWSFLHHFKSIGWIQTKVSPVSKLTIFVLCDPEIRWMTLENNRAPLLYHIELCVSFQSHVWTQTGVTVRKRSIRVKIGDFLSCVTSKFDGLSWKTIGHIFYTLSLVH